MNRHNPQMLYVGQTKDTGALAFTPDLIKANRNFILPFNGYIHHEDHIAALDAANEKIQSQQATIDKLVKALELAEKELFRFNCDAPIYLTGAKEPVYLQVRQCLAEVSGEK